MNLDDLAYFQSVDTHNLLRHVDALPQQVEAAWALGEGLALPEASRAPDHLLLVGRGDSAIAAEVARTLALPEARLPISLWTGRDLPAWVNAETLVVALSHSGNTVETLAVAEAALARGAMVLAITTGGRLAALNGATAWRYDHAGDARTALGYLALLALRALVKLGGVADPSAEVAEAVRALQAQQESLRAESPVSRNPAKRMAGQLMDRYALLFVADELAPAGRHWQAQINQLAKAWAQCLPLAEADHAIAGSMFPEALVGKYMALFLRGSSEPPFTRQRAEAVRMHFMTSGFNTDAIAAAGQGRLAQMLTLMHYGDYTAYYLAMCYGIDPGLVLGLSR